MKVKGSTFIRVLSIVFIVVFIFIISLTYIALNKTTIYQGISINGVDIGGLSKNKAIDKLNKEIQEVLNKRHIKIANEDYIYRARFKDMGISYDYYKGVNKAFLVGREGNVFKRLKDIYDARTRGIDIKIDIIYNTSKLVKVIKDVEKDIFIKSEDATISYKKGVFVITPEVLGRRVNSKVLEERIISSLPNKTFIEIPVENDIPKITEEKLSHIKYPISQYTTAFWSSSESRVNNIKLSSSKISGSVILPGEVLSFNKSTGVRDKDAGYTESKVILDGEFVTDIGGGVCQVSTTLYNAALLSNLDIVERHHHSIPVGYVPKGQDATVAYDYLDLKVRNNYPWPIYIHGIINGRQITFKVFGGKKEDNKNVQILSVLEETVKPKVDSIVDKGLSPGQRVVVEKGRYGYKVKTYKILYEDGQEVSRELLYNDYYKPKKEVVKVGPEVKASNNSGNLVQ